MVKAAEERVFAVADVVQLQRSTEDPLSVTLILGDSSSNGHAAPTSRTSQGGRETLRLRFDDGDLQRSEVTITALEALIIRSSSLEVRHPKDDGELAVELELLLSMFPDVDSKSVMAVLYECRDSQVAATKLLEMMRVHELQQLKECVVCLIEPRATRFDCGHACCCGDCADILLGPPDAKCPLCQSRISSYAIGPDEAGVPIARQPTFEEQVDSPPTSCAAYSQHSMVHAHLRPRQAGLRYLRANVFICVRRCFSPAAWRNMNNAARWALFPAIVILCMWAVHVHADRQPPLPPHPPQPPLAPLSASHTTSKLTQFTIDWVDGTASIAGGAYFVFVSPGIRLRTSGNRCMDFVREFLASVRLAMFGILIFAAGYVVGSLLSTAYDVHWDVHEFVILACDAVFGWHAMRHAVVRYTTGAFIVGGVQFGQDMI